MKIKEGFELRQVGDEFVVVTIGDAVSVFNGMIKLNDTAAFIWKKLSEGIDTDEVTKLFAEEYCISIADAQRDVKAFISSLEDTNCFTNLE